MMTVDVSVSCQTLRNGNTVEFAACELKCTHRAIKEYSKGMGSYRILAPFTWLLYFSVHSRIKHAISNFRAFYLFGFLFAQFPTLLGSM